MSVIIITPPPTKPPGSGTLEPATTPVMPYAEARSLIDQAEANGETVRIVET